MAVTKNEIPILEYDDSPVAVIQPQHEAFEMMLPERCVFAFCGDSVERFARENGAKQVGTFESSTKLFPVYTCTYDGCELCFCQAPVGSAAAAQFLDWLIGYGVTKIIATGSCGVLSDIPENSFLVPVKALRAEGASYHYLPPARWIELDKSGIQAVETALKKRQVTFSECATWSTDGFFRETAEFVAYRKSEGCQTVEMECASLAACARFRGATFGMFFFTADSLASVDDYKERGWGKASLEKALLLAFDAALAL